MALAFLEGFVFNWVLYVFLLFLRFFRGLVAFFGVCRVWGCFFGFVIMFLIGFYQVFNRVLKVALFFK